MLISNGRAPREDERNLAIVAERMSAIDARPGPRVGDYVRFACGTLRRISYHWEDGTGWDGGVQTSDAGSFHLGNYGCSFSGSLHSTVPTEELTLTATTLPGAVWIFHHGLAGAGRGVTFTPEFRVYTSPRTAP